jgi:Stealth protein CR2, conserved region 2/Stealth protein CR3, conserved region 3/Stealth protein CR4, conserved region 4/Stealth protein CR1, conserved region 1
MIPRTARAGLVARIPSTTQVRIGKLLGSGTWRRKSFAPGTRRPVVNGGARMRALVMADATPMGVRQRNLHLVTSALDAAAVPYFCRPTDGLRSSVVVLMEHLDAATNALRRLDEHVVVEQRRIPRIPSPLTADLTLDETQTTIRLFDPVTSPSGAWTLAHRYACDVEFWCRGGRNQLVGATPDGRACVVAADDPDVFAEGWQLCDRLPRDGRQVYRTKHALIQHTPESTRFPIDAVFTWVDGSDLDWAAHKHEALAGAGAGDLHATAANESRFTSRDELRYALRSVVAHAPWLRKIFLVTADQVPPWLDLGHPGVTVVRHHEIFADAGMLPTFNSHAIESRLHHIPDLAEHFIYFNDDMFLGRPVLPRQFFHANGLAKFFQSAAAIDPTPAGPYDLPVTAAAKNNRELMAARFGVTIHHKMRHAPYALRSSVLREMEDELPGRFAATASHRFRHPGDLSIPSSLAHYWGFATGRAVPDNIEMVYADLGHADTPTRLASILARRRNDVFCLNDTDADADPRHTAIVTEFLEAYFPYRAPFELPDDVTAARARRSATELLRSAAVIPTARPIPTVATTLEMPR